MRNLLFFITIFYLFSCNNAGKKEEMVLLNYSTNAIAFNGFDILNSIEKYCYKNPSDQYAKKTLMKAYDVNKKYKQFCHLADSVNDIKLIRKEIIQFYLQNHTYFRERDSFDISKLSSKAFIKNAAALIFCIALKELNKNLTSFDCAVYPYYNFDFYPKSDSIKLHEEFVGVITRERFFESFELTALLKNNYKVNYIKRNSSIVNDVKLNILAKNRILKLKPAKKGHYEIEVVFTVINLDSSSISYPTPIVFDVY